MKLKLLFYILILMTITFPVHAQELEITGYYENQFFPQKIKNDFVLQDYNKIRLDLSAQIAENVTFTGDYIYRTYHGKTTYNAFDFIPRSVISQYADFRNEIADSLRPAFDFEFQNENFLDNAYVSIYTKHANIRVGKQQLPWGSGYSWNPTDIFNDKDPLDPTYENVGVNAFKLEIPFSDEGMLTGILNIRQGQETSTKALKIKHHLAGFDLSFCFIDKEQDRFNYFDFEPVYEKRRLFGGDFSGELFGLGLWAEGAYNSMENSVDFGQYLIGTDFTFENGLYLTGEYYRNELGKANKNRYDIQDWMDLLGATGDNLGRDYLFLGERYPITELWNWSNFFILNMGDKSGMFFPWFDYNLNDNTELFFVGYIPFGEEKTEFGEFGAGGFARIRVYF